MAAASAPATRHGRSQRTAEASSPERPQCTAAAHRIEVVVLRPPAVYGPRDTDLFHFFRLARFGVVPVPTGPDRLLQMVHVTDLAAALVRAVAAPRASGVYHIAEPRMYTWEEVARLVGDAVGRRVRVVRVPAGLISGLAALSEWASGAVGGSSIFNRDKAREMLAPGWLCDTEAAQRTSSMKPASAWRRVSRRPRAGTASTAGYSPKRHVAMETA
jgi:hypothetical protein